MTDRDIRGQCTEHETKPTEERKEWRQEARSKRSITTEQGKREYVFPSSRTDRVDGAV